MAIGVACHDIARPRLDVRLRPARSFFPSGVIAYLLVSLRRHHQLHRRGRRRHSTRRHLLPLRPFSPTSIPAPPFRQPRHHRHDSSGHHEPLHRRDCSGEFPRHLCSASSHLDSITTATRSPCLHCPASALPPPARASCSPLPPRARPPPATLATEHALMSVATALLCPDVLPLFRLAYPSRAGVDLHRWALAASRALGGGTSRLRGDGPCRLRPASRIRDRFGRTTSSRQQDPTKAATERLGHPRSHFTKEQGTTRKRGARRRLRRQRWRRECDRQDRSSGVP